jgi:hypothetical protein
MRLSEWRAASPSNEAGSQKIAAIVDPILLALGAEPDPHCWVAWGDEPSVRYLVLVPTPAGLITSFVRVSVPGEGPRASSKLVRWSRVQLGELAFETAGGHRLMSFQIEQQVIHGSDALADRIARFALELFASVDGRTLPATPVGKKRGAARGTVKAPARTAAKPPAKSVAKPAAASGASPGRKAIVSGSPVAASRGRDSGSTR